MAAKASMPRLKGPAGTEAAWVLRYACVALASTVLATWIVAPMVTFLLCAMKEGVGPAKSLAFYVPDHIFNGFGALGAFEGHAVPLCTVMAACILCNVALWAGLWDRYSVPGRIRAIFGPAATRSNTQGSARLFADELLLSRINNTWAGEWEAPPPYATMVMGWSSRLRAFYLAPDEAHTVMFGIPGCGKTTRINIPSIDCMAAAGASAVVLDPKGELYNAVSRDLRALIGDENVFVVDLANPERSNCYNPLLRPYEAYREQKQIAAYELECARKCAAKAKVKGTLDAGLREVWPTDGAYEEFREHLNRSDAAMRSAWSRGSQLIGDLGAALIPERPDAGAGKHWEDTARKLLEALGMAVAMYEEDDWRGDGAPIAAPEPEMRTLASMRDLLAENGDAKGKGEGLSRLFDNIDHAHPAYAAFAQSRNSTAEHYATAVAETIKFLDALLTPAVNAILNQSDFDPAKLGDKQTFLFVVVPDERPAMGRLFALMMDQIYQSLVMSARAYGGRLPVRVNFLLEELGNVRTPIPDLANKLAMSRGYNMFFHITLQGMGQLAPIYGRDAQDFLISQCAVRMLLQTTDAQTTGRYFQDSMGSYTYKSASVTRSRKMLGLLDDSAATNVGEGSRYLFDAAEITRWNPEWGSIVLQSKPGRRPGFLAGLLGWQGAMMPQVIPSGWAWETPTAKNLGIPNDRSLFEQKKAAANGEERIGGRTPNVAWELVALQPGVHERWRAELGRGAPSRFVRERLAFGRIEDEAIRRARALAARDGLLKTVSDGLPPDEVARQVADTVVSGMKDRGLADSCRAAVERAIAADVVAYKATGDEPDWPNADTDSEGPLGLPAGIRREVQAAKPKQGTDKSWMDEMRRVLATSFKDAHTMTDFLSNCADAGVSVTFERGRTNCRMKVGSSSVTCSGEKLGARYAKEALEKRFAKAAKAAEREEVEEKAEEELR